MTAAAPRPSTSLCLLRDAGDGAEVLMARRGAAARFMPGAWVFPGGVIDPVDDSPPARRVVGDVHPEHASWLAAGAREVLEEAGIWLVDPPRAAVDRPRGAAFYERLVSEGRSLTLGGFALLANWVTPTMVPMRFDTRFYVGELGSGVEGEPDGDEMDEVCWVRPSAAVAHADAGEMLVAFPTRRILLALAGLGRPADIVSHARNLATVPVVQPRFRVEPDGSLRVLMPGDPGFADTPDLPPDAAALAAAPRVSGPEGEPVPELVRRAD